MRRLAVAYLITTTGIVVWAHRWATRHCKWAGDEACDYIPWFMGATDAN